MMVGDFPQNGSKRTGLQRIMVRNRDVVLPASLRSQSSMRTDLSG